MVVFDSSIVNIVIFKMMVVFNVLLDDVKWIVIVYVFILGVVIFFIGFLLEKFGSKKLYIFLLIIFILGFLFCGFLWSNVIMILF